MLKTDDTLNGKKYSQIKLIFIFLPANRSKDFRSVIRTDYAGNNNLAFTSMQKLTDSPKSQYTRLTT